MSRTGIEYSTRNDSVVKAGRNVIQKMRAEEEKHAALKDATEIEDPATRSQSVTMANESLTHAEIMLDAALLDYAETIKATFLLEHLQAQHDVQREVQREVNAAPHISITK